MSPEHNNISARLFQNSSGHTNSSTGLFYNSSGHTQHLLASTGNLSGQLQFHEVILKKIDHNHISESISTTLSTTTTTSTTQTLATSLTALLTTTQAPDPLGLHKMWLEFQAIQLPGIMVSLLVLILTMIICEVVYRLVIYNVILGLFKSVILDFVSAGEATIISWELITVFHGYGLPVWTVFAFIFMVIKYYRYRVECVSCPYSHVQSYLKGFLPLKEALLRIAAQFLGGSVFFRWQGYIWDFGLTPIHIGRAYWMSYGKCTSWLAVSTWLGFLYEFVGSLICGVSGSLLFDFQLFPSITVHVRIFASTAITVLLVLGSFYHTGGFFQPLLAFARTYGCIGVLREVTILDHVIVYWVGATLGAVAGMYLTPYIRNIITKCATKLPSAGVQNLKLKGIEESMPLVSDDDDEEHNVIYQRKEHEHNT